MTQNHELQQNIAVHTNDATIEKIQEQMIADTNRGPFDCLCQEMFGMELEAFLNEVT